MGMAMNGIEKEVDSGAEGMSTAEKVELGIDIALDVVSTIGAIFSFGGTAAANAARKAAQLAARMARLAAKAAKKAAQAAAKAVTKKTAQEAAKKTLEKATERATKKAMKDVPKKSLDAAKDKVEKAATKEATAKSKLDKAMNAVDNAQNAKAVADATKELHDAQEESKKAKQDVEIETIKYNTEVDKRVRNDPDVKAAQKDYDKKTEEYNAAADEYEEAKKVEDILDKGVKDFNTNLAKPENREKYPDLKPIPVETHKTEHDSAKDVHGKEKRSSDDVISAAETAAESGSEIGG